MRQPGVDCAAGDYTTYQRPSPEIPLFLRPLTARQERACADGWRLPGGHQGDWLAGFQLGPWVGAPAATLGAWWAEEAGHPSRLVLTTRLCGGARAAELARLWGALRRWALLAGVERLWTGRPWGEAEARPLRLAGWRCVNGPDTQVGEPLTAGDQVWALDTDLTGSITMPRL